MRSHEQKLEYQREYYAANREQKLTWQRAYYDMNRERRLEWQRAHYAMNREHKLEYQHANYATNREQRQKYQREYIAAHRGSINARNKKRKTATINRTAVWANPGQIRSFYEMAARLTKTRGAVYHVDHILPLQGKRVSGLHVQNNLQILTAAANAAKGNRLESAWVS